VTEAVVTVCCTPDDGCGWHPKHVERTCRINRLFCVASHWTIINTVIISKFTAAMEHVGLLLINNYSHVTWVAVYHSGCVSAFKTQLFSDIVFGKSHTITSDDIKLVSIGNNCGHITWTESTSFLFVPQILMERSLWKFISDTALEMALRDQWIIKPLYMKSNVFSAVSYLALEQCFLVYVWDITYFSRNCLSFAAIGQKWRVFMCKAFYLPNMGL